MNFQEALTNLNQGKKIRRTCWENGHYWVLNEKYKIVNSMEENPIVNKNQIEADDWEVYEEELCLMDKLFIGTICSETEIKTSYCFERIGVEEFISRIINYIKFNSGDYDLIRKIREFYGK